jgi:hypothetical protein
MVSDEGRRNPLRSESETFGVPQAAYPDMPCRDRLKKLVGVLARHRVCKLEMRRRRSMLPAQLTRPSTATNGFGIHKVGACGYS